MIIYEEVNIKNRYFYRLKGDYILFVPSLQNYIFEGEFLQVKNGNVIVKNGYAWNGNTPKTLFLGILFGTPDGFLGHTLEASLLHDALYQYGKKFNLSRKEADKIYFEDLKRLDWQLAKVYNFFVRLLGWINY